jgi:hypothetical protein
MITRAVAKYLADEGTDLTYAVGASTGNVFVGRFPSIPERSLAVIGSGGLPVLSSAPTNLPAFQVMVRGDVDDQDSADELAAWVIDQLTCLDGVWLDQDGDDEVWLIGCTALQSEPIDLGLDPETRCYERSTNFQARTHNPTTHRPGA